MHQHTESNAYSFMPFPKTHPTSTEFGRIDYCLFGLGMFFSMVGCEWLHVPGVYHIKLTLRVVALLLLAVAAIRVVRRVPLTINEICFAAILTLPVGIAVTFLVIETPPLANLAVQSFLMGVPFSLLCLLTGRSIAVDSDAFCKTLRFFAKAFSLVGVYFVFARLVFPASSFAPGFPVSLLTLFGVSWFLTEFLCSPTMRRDTFLWLCISLSDPIIGLHKPIVFSLMFCVSTVFILCSFRFSAIQSFVRLGLLLVPISISAFVGNFSSGGHVAESVESRLREHYLRNASLSQDSVSDTLKIASSGRATWLWPDAIALIRKRPYFGYGVWVVFPTGDGTAINVHQGFLDLLLSVGIVGAIPILGLIGIWLRKFLQMIRWPSSFTTTVATGAYFASLFAYNLGGQSRLFPTVTGFACFLMAGMLRMRADTARSEYWHQSSNSR